MFMGMGCSDGDSIVPFPEKDIVMYDPEEGRTKLLYPDEERELANDFDAMSVVLSPKDRDTPQRRNAKKLRQTAELLENNN